MAAELDVSISSQQAVSGGNELVRICDKIIQAIKQVDTTITAGQKQIDSLGKSFTEESKAISNAVTNLGTSFQKATSGMEEHSKAQDKNTSRAEQYILKLRDLARVEQFSVDINKKLGIASEETAKRKAVYTAQTLRHIAATSEEGQAVDSLIRRLHLLKGIRERQESVQENIVKRQAFNTALSQEAEILSRVNARATELGVKTTELTAYKQFLAQATKLNIDFNSEEFASLQQLYIAKEQQILISKQLNASGKAVAATPSFYAGAPQMATTPSSMNVETVVTGQLVSLYRQYSSNVAELAIQKEILNRKTAAGNSLTEGEAARIEKSVRVMAANRAVIEEFEQSKSRQDAGQARVNSAMGGAIDENIQLQQQIDLYRQFGRMPAELAIQKEVLNRVTAAGGVVTDKERAGFEATARVAATKRAELAKLEQQYDKTNASVGRVSTGLTRMQLILSGMAYMGISRAVSSVADFYTNLSIANAVTEATTYQMAALEKQARSLGKSTVFTAGEAAQGIQFLGQAGMEVRDIMKTLPDALSLASAGSIDLGRSADIATNIMAAFGLRANEFGQAADVIAYAAAKSNTNVEQLAEGMKFAGPAARAVGLDLGETAAIMGTLSNAGIQASMAGTSLRQSLIQLSKEPTKNAKKALKELGLTFDDVNLRSNSFYDVMTKLSQAGMGLGQAAAIFDTRAATAMLALSKMIPQWDKLNTGIKGATGTAERMARIRLDNLTGDFRLLASATEELILTLGDAGLLRMMRDMATGSKDVVLWTKDVVGAWNEWWDTSEKSVESLTRYSETAHDVAEGLGLLGIGIKSFNVNLAGSKTEAEKASPAIKIVKDQAANLAMVLSSIVGLKIAAWGLDAALGLSALAGGITKAWQAGILLEAVLGLITLKFRIIFYALYGGKLIYEMHQLTQETEAANTQVGKMNDQLKEMAGYSKGAAKSLIEVTAEEYKALFESINITPSAKITVDDPKPKELAKDWHKINDLVNEYKSYGWWLPVDKLKHLDQLELAQNAMLKMYKTLTFAAGAANTTLNITKVKLDNLMESASRAVAIMSGIPGAIFQVPKPKLPDDDAGFGGGGEDRGKSYENFVKNLERAAKEQKKLNELRVEFGNNEDLINLKLKIYNTLLEARDIKGGISKKEETRIQNLITEASKQEDVNKSLKSFLDLQKQVADQVELAGKAQKYGSDSSEFYVEKEMSDFLKSNTNLNGGQITKARELFAQQFKADQDIKNAKSNEKEEAEAKKKAAEAYSKYIDDIERDIQVTTRKKELTMEYSHNQHALNSAMKDYEQELKIISELERLGIKNGDDRAEEIRRQIRLRDAATESYEREREQVKKAVEVNKELASSIVDAVRNAKSFRDAFIRLGDAAEELVIKLVANKAMESLFGLLMGGGKGAGNILTENTVAIPHAKGGAFFGGSEVTMFGQGGLFTSTTAFPMPNGTIGIAGERGDEVFMPASRMSNGDVGVRVQVPASASKTPVAISNQFNIKIEGGSKEQNEDAANQVSKSIERAVKNVVYEVLAREKGNGGVLR